jgi:hypothetical protein
MSDRGPNGIGGLTRRALVKSGGVAVLALAVPGQALAKLAATPSYLRRSSYGSLLGQRFSVSGSGFGLTLVGVEDLNSRQANSENAFALVFQAPAGAPPIADAVPELGHGTLGSFSLLISPSRSGRRYGAVINRLSA